MPVFNVCGKGIAPQKLDLAAKEEIDCFGEESFFHDLIQQDGYIIQYGSSYWMSMTFMHYCERMSGKLLYRFDKRFKGEVIDNNTSTSTSLVYHVRPLNGKVQYAWPRFEDEMIKEGLLKFARSGKRFVGVLKARDVFDYLTNKIKDDPFYLLSQESRVWVEKQVEKLGRGFLRSDFEEYHED